MASVGSSLSRYIDLGKPSLLVSACAIAFNPLFWNIVARQGPTEKRSRVSLVAEALTGGAEYHNKMLSRLFCGRSRTACYALAVTIFSLGLFRDLLYKRALQQQPSHPLLLTPMSQMAAYGLLACGNTLVISSTWALGVTGTFLGDYFGILMDDMVTGFPFNVCSAPMYWGSTMSFLGTALFLGKPAGVVLTGWVFAVYVMALRYEDPFTAEIYAKRERERAAAKSDKKQT